VKPTKTYWEFKILYAFSALVWTVTILFLSLSSFEKVNLPINVSGHDKLAHLLMYSIYAFAIVFSFRNIKNRKLKFYFYIFLYLFLFGGFMEVLQGTLTKNRNADFLDAVANGIGALIGITFAYAIVKSKKKFNY